MREGGARYHGRPSFLCLTCYTKHMNVQLDVSKVPRPSFPKNSVTLKQWCDEFDRLIFETTRTRTSGSVAVLARETGLGYSTVLHAKNEKRSSDPETAELLHKGTGGQVPEKYLTTSLDRRKNYSWPKKAA